MASLLTTSDSTSSNVHMEINSVWLWAAVAAILLAGEIITTSFVLVFFAVAAAITALVTLLHPELKPAAQLILFGFLGLIGLVGGRKWIRAKLASRAVPAFDVDHNSEFNVDRDLAVGAEGAVLYQGSPWTAVNDGGVPISAGDRVKVVRTSGIKIMIVKVKS